MLVVLSRADGACLSKSACCCWLSQDGPAGNTAAVDAGRGSISDGADHSVLRSDGGQLYRLQHQGGWQVCICHDNGQIQSSQRAYSRERIHFRGLALYTYDEQGKLRRPAEFWAVALNGEGTNMYKAFSEFGLDYGGTSSQFKYWSNRSAFTAQLEVKVTLTDLAKWPAFGVRMANVANDSASTIVLDSAGLLYVSPGMKTCQVVNPSNPPPSPVNTEITVTAPDWDLGELERGKETMRTFTTDAQRLCFRYNAKYIEYDKYLISVSSRNGVADNKFLLVSAADGSETVPYTLSFTGAARRWRCPVSMDCR